MANRRYLTSGVTIPELNGLRGVAILMVLWYHCTRSYRSGLEIDPAFRLSAGALVGDGTGHGFGTDFLYQLAGAGWQGVDLFFVLSGFLITGILIDTKHKASSLTAFYYRRALRIFPVYFLTLAILYVVIPTFTDLGSRYPEAIDRQAFDWTYTTNFKLAVSDLPSNQQWNRLTVHFWSLAIEEQFYLLWPFLVTLLSTRAFKRMCYGLIAAHIIVRIYYAVHAPGLLVNHHDDVALYFVRYDALVAGALLAVWVRDPAVTADHVVRRARVVLWASLAAFSTQVLIAGKVRTPLLYLVGYPVNAALGAALVALAACSDPRTRLARVLRAPMLGGIGTISYALYLVHPMLVFCFEPAYDAMAHSLPPIVALVLMSLLVLTVALAIAVTSWTVLERPLLRLKRYVTVARDSR